MNIRFLEANEYAASLPLFIRCFGEDEEFLAEYYGDVSSDGRCTGKIAGNRIAVLEEEGEIRSMVQIQPEQVLIRDAYCTIPYILGVCTDPAYRHRGYMDRVMEFVNAQLIAEGYPWCFLIAVDRDIYRHLGFSYDFPLSEEACVKLYADDGLDTASARSLNGKEPYGTETFTLLL